MIPGLLLSWVFTSFFHCVCFLLCWVMGWLVQLTRFLCFCLFTCMSTKNVCAQCVDTRAFKYVFYCHLACIKYDSVRGRFKRCMQSCCVIMITLFDFLQQRSILYRDIFINKFFIASLGAYFHGCIKVKLEGRSGKMTVPASRPSATRPSPAHARCWATRALRTEG